MDAWLDANYVIRLFKCFEWVSLEVNQVTKWKGTPANEWILDYARTMKEQKLKLLIKPIYGSDRIFEQEKIEAFSIGLELCIDIKF